MATGFLLKRTSGGGSTSGLVLTSTTVENYFTAFGSGAIVPGDFVRLSNQRTTTPTNVLTNNSSFQGLPHKTLKINETEYFNIRAQSDGTTFFLNFYRLNTTTKVVTVVSANVSFIRDIVSHNNIAWDAIMLDDGRLVVGWANSSNQVEFKTFSVNGTTGNITYLNRSFFTSFDVGAAPNTHGFRFAPVRNNIFAVTTSANNPQSPYVRLLQVDSGGTITFLTPAFLIFGTSYTSTNGLYLSKIDDNRLLLSFMGVLGQQTTTLGALILYTTNNILTMGSVFVVNDINTAPAQFACVNSRISSDKVGLAWYAVWNGNPSFYRTILNFDGATLSAHSTSTLNGTSEQFGWSNQSFNSWQINISGWGHLNNTGQHIISTFMQNRSNTSSREVRVRLFDLTSELLGITTASTGSASFSFSANPGEAHYLPSINNVIGFFNAWDTTINYGLRALVYYNLNNFSVTKATTKNQIKGVARTAANSEQIVEVVTLTGTP
jgi:hypothetical protein